MVESGDKIDMSLDDIIRKDRISVGGQRRRGGSGLQNKSRSLFRRSFGGRFNTGQQTNGRQFYGNGRQSYGNSRHPYGRSGARQQSNGWIQRKVNQMSCRLMVSNLAYSVTDDDLFELFASFGPLKKSTVHYDQFGRSLGTAELVFEMHFDAITAVNQYNGVPLDGRPMRIRVIGSKVANEWPPSSTGAGSGGTRGRGRGGGRGGQSGGGRQRFNVTAEDLDKDLDTWRTMEMDTE